MRWNSFGRSLLFAAIAGAAWPAFALFAAPLLGFRAAFSLYLVGTTAVYVAGLAPSLARGIASAFVAVAIAVGVAVLAGTSHAAALGAAIALGLARSGLLYRNRGARAIAIEALLLGGGLALARFLLADGVLGPALALWGFFLVQSAFFAIGGLQVRDAVVVGDRFESARRRALALLEEEA
jgi:hypothetical protein